jgi:hypothetical protein
VRSWRLAILTDGRFIRPLPPRSPSERSRLGSREERPARRRLAFREVRRQTPAARLSDEDLRVEETAPRSTRNVDAPSRTDRRFRDLAPILVVVATDPTDDYGSEYDARARTPREEPVIGSAALEKGKT